MLSKTTGIYYGEHTNQFEVYTDIDFSKKAFLYSGQNSSYPGMFKNIYLNSKIMQNRFETANQILDNTFDRPIAEYIISDSTKDITSSLAFKNIALYLAQVSLFEELVSLNVVPSIVTGHSFGEFAALTTAGILSVEDGLKIIYARDANVASDKKGRMFAVNINYEKLLELKKTADFEFYISNVNSAKQCVVSAAEKNTAHLTKFFKTKKVAAVQLDLPFPYHSELINHVQNDFLNSIALDTLRFRKPRILFLSSVTNELISADTFSVEKIKEIIKNQLTQPVRFDIQIEKIRQLKINNFIEIGPSKVLAVFAKDTGMGIPTKVRLASEYFASDEEKKSTNASPERSSGFFTKILNKAIVAVTGYEVTSIDIADRLQEDLGIDSIKKAEIIFKVLDEVGIKNNSSSQNVRVSDLSTINDLLHYFDYQQMTYLQTDPNLSLQKNITFLNANDNFIKKNRGQLLQSCLRPYELLEFIVDINQQSETQKQNLFKFINKMTKKNKVIHFLFNTESLMSNGSDISDTETLYSFLKKAVIYFSSFKINHAVANKDICFQFILNTDDLPEMTTLRSFLKTWALEQSIVSSQIIEISNNTYGQLRSDIIFDTLDVVNSYIKYNGYDRYVSEMNIQPSHILKSNFSLDNKIYLVIGGFSGIGLEILENIKSSLGSNIYVLGSSSSEQENIKNRIQKYKNENFNIHYIQCDARNIDHLNKVISEIINSHGTLDLIINCAGAVISKKLDSRTIVESEQELSVKVKVVSNLAFLAKQGNIKQVINFSSIIGYYPNIGQAVYALANSYVDYLSSILDKKIGCRFQSVRWPAWDNTGVTKANDNKKYVDLLGMSKLSTQLGVDYFFDILTSEESVTTIIDENSKLKCQNNNINNLAFSQFISNFQSPLYNDNLILSGLTLDNLPFLKDHLLTGKPILASSNMIAIYMQMGFAIWGEIPSLKSFFGHNFIFIEQKKSSVLLDLKRNTDEIQMKMKTTYIHSEAKVSKNRNLEPLFKKIPEYKTRLNPEKLRTKIIETVGDFEYTRLFFVDFKNKDVLMQVSKNNLSNSTKMPIFDLIFNLVEISHQIIGTKSQWITGKYSVPQSISELDFFENTEITDNIYSFCESFIIDGKHSMADSFLVNDRGEVILRILGNRFAEINVDADLANRFEILTSHHVAKDNNL